MEEEGGLWKGPLERENSISKYAVSVLMELSLDNIEYIYAKNTTSVCTLKIITLDEPIRFSSFLRKILELSLMICLS